MRKEVYFCDHCGKRLDPTNDIFELDFDDFCFIGDVDLCRECFDDICEYVLNFCGRKK